MKHCSNRMISKLALFLLGLGCTNIYAIDLPETMAMSTDGTRILQGKQENTGLYDQTILHTLNLAFKQPDWWAQLTANYASEKDIPADLTVEGVTYYDVGVRFKGITSYSATGNSQKKSFNISLDFTNPDQRLMGYKTLNLHNSFSDATFMREMLYFHVMKKYAPVPKTSYVKLTINGENWGLYVHVQQLNADMIEEWFTNDNGNRWKAGIGTIGGGGAIGGNPGGGGQFIPGGGTPPGGGTTNPQQQQLTLTQWLASPQASDLNGDGKIDQADYDLFIAQQQIPIGPGGPFQPGGGTQPGGGGAFGGGTQALTYLGSDSTAYINTYEMKSGKTNDPWGKLIKTCDVLNNTPLEQLPDTLESVLAVDRWLWFLAVENVFTDEDGYLTKGWDYQFYYDTATGQIHPLEHDGNESFFTNDIRLSPVEGETNANRPVISRLLSVPAFRQRYLAHMRTILHESFDWSVLGPKAAQYQSLIETEVLSDTKKLSTNADFLNSQTTLENLITTRRDFLLTLAEINRQAPAITAATRTTSTSEITNSQSVPITAQINGAANQVILYYGDGTVGRFNNIAMVDDGAHHDGSPGDNIYGAAIPPFPAGSLVRYYIEARASDQTASFLPSGAEHDVFVYQVAQKTVASSPIVINEFLASNTKTLQDPQGQYEDWIELVNISRDTVNLSGMYLSDNDANLKKWPFPEGTKLGPGQYLIVFADEDGKDEGLHANFKLSASGESITLCDTDANGNTLLDTIAFGTQTSDVSYGRFPNGTGTFQAMSATPNQANTSTSAVTSDFDQNGTVDFADFLLLAGQFGKTSADPAFNTWCDLDRDGTIGFSDFLIFAGQFGKKTG